MSGQCQKDQRAEKQAMAQQPSMVDQPRELTIKEQAPAPTDLRIDVDHD